jgi:hypothetical protein
VSFPENTDYRGVPYVAGHASPVSPPPAGYPPQYGYPQQYPPQRFGTPPKPKKKLGGLAWFLIIVGAGLVVCGGGAAVIYGAVSAGKSASAPSKTANLNEPARDGKFEFVVKSVSCGNAKVGDDTLGKTAQGQYCLVDLTIQNIGNSAQRFSSTNVKGESSGGAKFDTDTAAEIYANDQAQTFFEDINPGNTVHGTLVFDIPKQAQLEYVDLHDSVFSGGVRVKVS